ncbi:MAG: sirohydrochlorin cobaltochelatase [Planctomycetota bacterium]|jgi:sirohydrochlorin cobaltochelatase|nr:sirohydrochlorin cobaltochelatase [Planctomycetota bacterium]
MCGKWLATGMAAVFAFAACGFAPAYDRPERDPAIVLAAFGTTDVEAVHSILNIKERVEAAFPNYEVYIAFTSNIIRHIWHERADDAGFRAKNKDIPDEIYGIGGILTTLAHAQEDGARLILVQSLHVTDGEEYTDLASTVDSLANLKTMKRVRHPFPWIGVGEPALGLGDGQSGYLERAAAALAPLARKAWDSGAALVLMGHGNEHLNQNVFAKFTETLREAYGPHVYLGTVEAAPLGEDIVEEINAAENAPKKVLLAPLMVVAGDHTKNDMAGDGEDSWASMFKEAGYEVDLFIQGLGSNDGWADIYVEHLKALEPKVAAQMKSEPEEEKGH